MRYYPKDQGNRGIFRNLLFMFQKKHNIIAVNGVAKLHNALADHARAKGINYCYLSFASFNDLVLDLLSTASVECSTQQGQLLNDWPKYFNSSRLGV